MIDGRATLSKTMCQRVEAVTLSSLHSDGLLNDCVLIQQIEDDVEWEMHQQILRDNVLQGGLYCRMTPGRGMGARCLGGLLNYFEGYLLNTLQTWQQSMFIIANIVILIILMDISFRKKKIC